MHDSGLLVDLRLERRSTATFSLKFLYHPQPTSMIRLSRPYKNTRCRPTNLKEAMKANIYFAPPGFDLPAYTVLIIRMFEKFRRRLCVAQSKVKARIPWGSPVPPGTRDTLDLQLSKKSPASTGTRGSVFLRNSPHRGALLSAVFTNLFFLSCLFPRLLATLAFPIATSPFPNAFKLLENRQATQAIIYRALE